MRLIDIILAAVVPFLAKSEGESRASPHEPKYFLVQQPQSFFLAPLQPHVYPGGRNAQHTYLQYVQSAPMLVLVVLYMLHEGEALLHDLQGRAAGQTLALVDINISWVKGVQAGYRALFLVSNRQR